MDNTKVEITADLIKALLREQHPDLAGLSLSLGALGWDNQLWRLGDDLAVRLPWATDDADELLLKEHSLLPGLASRLPLPIPVPKRLGQPSDRFPRSWIVTTWVPGEPADRMPATNGVAAADALAGFLSGPSRASAINCAGWTSWTRWIAFGFCGGRCALSRAGRQPRADRESG